MKHMKVTVARRPKESTFRLARPRAVSSARLAFTAVLALLFAAWQPIAHRPNGPHGAAAPPEGPAVAEAAVRQADDNAPQPHHENSVEYVETTSARVPLKVVFVDLNDPDVKVTGMLAEGGGGHAEAWGHMVDRARPAVAVTGTYFDMANLLPVGDIVVGGRLVHYGGIGTALCVDANNVATFCKAPRYEHSDWSAYDFVMRSGPRLVWDGKVSADPVGEGFHDPGLRRRTGRIAVGLTDHNKLVIAATREPISLRQMGQAMKGLGAVYAMNLDAGSSMGMYVGGKTLIQPHRTLTNLLLVYTDPDRYASVKDDLAPGRVAAN